MPLVAKRKIRQTWREAVAARAEALLPQFDAIHRESDDAGEAAYRVLAAAGLLWRVDEPGRMASVATSRPEEDPSAR